LPAGLLILGLNYIWVLRSDAKFEEASAELAEKMANVRQSRRLSVPKARTTVSAPFTLALEGRPETAIFWKNLIMVGRYLSLATLFRILPILVIFSIVARGRAVGGAGEGLTVLCGAVFVFTILLGPQFARNDLRQDLPNLRLLKAWPLDGATLVRGEVLAPAALLTVVAWLGAIGTVIFARSIPTVSSWATAAIVVAPGLILLQLLAQNAIAVMWPAWVMTGNVRTRGIDVMGQRLIMMAGLLLVLIVAVIPAAIIWGLTRLALYFVTGTLTIIVPALVAAAVLFIEAYLASYLVGKMLDRTDVSAIDAQE